MIDGLFFFVFEKKEKSTNLSMFHKRIMLDEKRNAFDLEESQGLANILIRTMKYVMMACIKKENKAKKYQTESDKNQRTQFKLFDHLKFSVGT